MKALILTLIPFSWIFALVPTQVVGATFAKTYAPPGGHNDFASGLVTPDGGYVVTGTHNDASASLEARLTVMRIASDGVVLWQRVFPDLRGSADIASAPDGGVVVLGGSAEGGVLINLAGDGELGWQRVLLGASLFTIQGTDDGGYVVGGLVVNDTTGKPSGSIVKLTAFGEIQWQRVVNDVFRIFVRQRPDGGYIAVGAVDSGLQPTVVVRLSQQGEVESVAAFGHPGLFSSPVGMDTTNDGGVVFATIQRSVVKLSSENQVEWAWQFGNLFIEAFGTNPIRQTQDGGYVIGISVFNGTNNAGLARLDGRGEVLWARYLETPQSTAEVVGETPDGGYVSFGDAATNNFGLVIKVDASGRIAACPSLLEIPFSSTSQIVEPVASEVNVEPGDVVATAALFAAISLVSSVAVICEDGASPSPPTISFSEFVPGRGSAIEQDVDPFDLLGAEGVVGYLKNRNVTDLSQRDVGIVKRFLGRIQLDPILHAVAICTKGSLLDLSSIRMVVNGVDVSPLVFVLPRVPSLGCDSSAVLAFQKFWFDATVHVEVTARTQEGTSANTTWSFTVETTVLKVKDVPGIIVAIRGGLVDVIMDVLEALLLPTPALSL